MDKRRAHFHAKLGEELGASELSLAGSRLQRNTQAPYCMLVMPMLMLMLVVTLVVTLMLGRTRGAPVAASA